jgi:hypothetical protein
VNPSFLIFSGAAVLLVALLIWLLRDSGNGDVRSADLNAAEESGRRHVTYFPQIRQAMLQGDFAFLRTKNLPRLESRVRKERGKIILVYLECLRSDFSKLWKLSRVVAAMSPRVGTARELARFRLGVTFYVRYEIIRLRFLFGFGAMPDLSGLSEIIGNLAVRLETAMNNLGERAALAAELSAFNGRGLDVS